MASFFQPTSQSLAIANDTRFEIYYNAILTKEQLTENWYQDLVIALGGSAWTLGCFILALQDIRKRWRRNGNRLWKKSPKRQSSAPSKLPWLFRTSQGKEKAATTEKLDDGASEASSSITTTTLGLRTVLRILRSNRCHNILFAHMRPLHSALAIECATDQE